MASSRPKPSNGGTERTPTSPSGRLQPSSCIATRGAKRVPWSTWCVFDGRLCLGIIAPRKFLSSVNATFCGFVLWSLSWMCMPWSVSGVFDRRLCFGSIASGSVLRSGNTIQIDVLCSRVGLESVCLGAPGERSCRFVCFFPAQSRFLLRAIEC